MFIDNVNIRNMDIVNMANNDTPYHHGDLRAKLVEAAIACVETDGASKVSLRKIAGQLGVSHNAPYMHFANKDALLDAVVIQGFDKLRTNISQAGGVETLTDGGWSKRLKAGFNAYIAFGWEHPGLYALMHIPRWSAQASAQKSPQTQDTPQPGAAMLDGLAATLTAGQRLGKVRAGETSEMALWVWATLHGLSSLASEKRLAFAGKSPKAVSDAVLDHLIQALAD